MGNLLGAFYQNRRCSSEYSKPAAPSVSTIHARSTSMAAQSSSSEGYWSRSFILTKLRSIIGSFGKSFVMREESIENILQNYRNVPEEQNSWRKMWLGLEWWAARGLHVSNTDYIGRASIHHSSPPISHRGITFLTKCAS